MQDISKIIVNLLIENDENIQTLKDENDEMSKKLDAIWSERQGYCGCGCGKYFYHELQPTGYWCTGCEKHLSREHRDDLTGDYCMRCKTINKSIIFKLKLCQSL